MSFRIVIFLCLLAFPACGAISNFSYIDTGLRAHEAMVWANKVPNHPEQVPFGGTRHNVTINCYNAAHPPSCEEVQDTIVHTNILFIPGVIITTGLWSVDMVSSLAIDIATLPYTVPRALFFP